MPFRSSITYVFLLLFVQYNVFAQKAILDPNKKLTQYILNNWTTEEGLPSNALLDIVQDEEGYLWIASYGGLIRFDGITFNTFNRSNIKGLKTNSITKLFVSKTNGLLIGTEGSDFLSYRMSAFSSLNKKGVLNYTSAIFEDSKSNIWLGTSGEGIYKINAKEVGQETYSKQFSDNKVLSTAIVNAIVEGKNGEIWFATEDNGIASLKDGNLKLYHTKDGLGDDKILSLFVDRDNKLWVGTRSGLSVFDKGVFKIIPELEGKSVTTILQDDIGSLWFGTKSGLYRYVAKANRWDELTDKDGLTYNYITKLIIDKEGTLWMTTYRGGMASLQDGIFTNYTRQEGVNSKSINSVCEITGNRVLLGGDAGSIDLVANNQVAKFPFFTKIKDRIRNIYQDSKQNIWVSSYEGLLKISPNKLEKVYKEKDGLPSNLIRLTTEDSQGNIWIGTKTGGVAKLAPDGQITVFNKTSGFPSNFIMSIDEDPDGNIWVGTNNVGVLVIDKENKITRIDATKGLSSNLIFNITFDKNKVAWITTNNGFNRCQNGKITVYTSENNLPSDAVFDLLIDANDYVWLPSNNGVISVSLKELNDYHKDKNANIIWKIYGKHDGMKHADCTGATQSLLTKSGEVWFPTLGGVVMSDPKLIKREGQFPTMYIDMVKVDDKVYHPKNGVLNLPAGSKRLIIHYKAIHLSAPKKIKYAYTLANYDQHWSYVGSERSATYTNLSGGTYTFKLKASNAHGLWNDKPMKLKIEIGYFFYQTSLFYILLIITLAIVIISVIRLRVYQEKKNSERLQQKIDLQTKSLKEKNDALKEEKLKLEKSYENTSILNDIGQKISGILNFEELGVKIYENVNGILKADILGLALFDSDQKVLEYISYIYKGEKREGKKINMRDKFRPSVQSFMYEKQILSNDAEKEFPLYYQSRKEIKSFIYVPLILGDEKTGIIVVQSFEKEAYQPYDIEMIKNLAIFVATALDNAKAFHKIGEQKKIIEDKNNDITDSILYAKRIQDLTLPKVTDIKKGFDDSFVFFRPKDIVSGDYYWYANVKHHRIIAAIDATGHGVPGAFMSLIGINLLNEIVLLKGVTAPGEILDLLHKGVRNALQQKDSQNNDGMDMALCSYFNPPQDKIEVLGEPKMFYAGARNPLIYLQEEQVFEIKAEKRSIGGWWDRYSKDEEYFTEYEIPTHYGGWFYMFSDGYQDQFSSITRKKLAKSRMKSLFFEFRNEDGKTQEFLLEKSLRNWQAKEGQIDDVLIIGFKITPRVQIEP